MSEQRFHELYPITALLLLLNAGFFALEVLAHMQAEGQFGQAIAFGVRSSVLERLGWLDTRAVLRGEVWRLLTCAFLHAGFVHFAVNMFWLVDLGRFAEPLLSRPKFFTVYVLCALGASVGSVMYAHYLPDLLGSVGIHGFHPLPRISVGASGAIAGLFGLALTYAFKEKHTELRDTLIRWLIIIVLITLLLPRVDHVGHAGGFLTGALLGLTVKDYMTSRSAARWRWPAYATGLGLAAALGFGLWTHFSRLLGNA